MAAEIRTWLEPRRAGMADLLVELAGIESATDDPAGLSRMADRLEELVSPFGPIARHPIGPGARHLVPSVDGAAPATADRLPPAAVLGHYDTVWPTGSAERSPARVDSAGIVTVPGCFDMKGGLVQLYYALAEPHRMGRPPRRPVRILCDCDEEVRSRTSQGLIKKLAATAEVAYVLEPPLPGGGLKTGRKGVAIYRLEIADLSRPPMEPTAAGI